MNVLTPDHRARVQAIIDQVNANSLDRRAAAQQIDGILSPAEAQAVLEQEQGFRNAMRQAFAANPNAQSYQGQGRPMGANGASRRPDAGRFLIMVSTARRPQP